MPYSCGVYHSPLVLGIAAPSVPVGPAANAAPLPTMQRRETAKSPDRANVHAFMVPSVCPPAFERRRHEAPILGSPRSRQRVALAVLPRATARTTRMSRDFAVGFRCRTGKRQGRSRPERTGHRRPKRLNYAQAPIAAAWLVCGDAANGGARSA